MQAPQPPDFMVFTGNANPGLAAEIASAFEYFAWAPLGGALL
jgi:hypothetical protein